MQLVWLALLENNNFYDVEEYNKWVKIMNISEENIKRLNTVFEDTNKILDETNGWEKEYRLMKARKSLEIYCDAIIDIYELDINESTIETNENDEKNYDKGEGGILNKINCLEYYKKITPYQSGAFHQLRTLGNKASHNLTNQDIFSLSNKVEWDVPIYSKGENSKYVRTDHYSSTLANIIQNLHDLSEEMCAEYNEKAAEELERRKKELEEQQAEQRRINEENRVKYEAAQAEYLAYQKTKEENHQMNVRIRTILIIGTLICWGICFFY